VREILNTTTLKMKEGSELGHESQTKQCVSWNQAVYDRLILEGHNHFDLIPWASTTKKAMTSVHATKKAAALLGHGLLLEADYCAAMDNFKASKFYPVRPNLSKHMKDKATDAAALRKWEAEVETAKLRYVCEFPFPHQGKENVHSVRHRLGSCLYYTELSRVHNADTVAKKRKTTDD
jgi:hypothetical protein